VHMRYSAGLIKGKGSYDRVIILNGTPPLLAGLTCTCPRLPTISLVGALGFRRFLSALIILALSVLAFVMG
jgi:hypothetical protein